MKKDDTKEQLIKTELGDRARLLDELARTRAGVIRDIADRMIITIQAGGKVVFFGNGGSAADAQHLTAELVGRFKIERSPLAAICLNTDTCLMTAIGNDYGFEHVFSRQVAALVQPGDVVVALSTSGRSKNVIEGIRTAKQRGAFTVVFTGASGESVAGAADIVLTVPSEDTPAIQEAHVSAGHIICGLVESAGPGRD